MGGDRTGDDSVAGSTPLDRMRGTMVAMLTCSYGFRLAV